MKPSQYLSKSFWGAAGVLVYVSLIALFFSHAQTIFGNAKGFLVPVLMLLLLVISATITGFLVLGRPVNMYMSGEKKEAWMMLFWTVGWLIVFLIAVAAVLLLK